MYYNEFVFESNDLTYVVEAAAKVRWADEGIGHYEFWGTTGYDSDMQPEIVQITLEKFQVYTDEDTLLETTNELSLQAQNVFDDNYDVMEEVFISMAEADGMPDPREDYYDMLDDDE
jgi:hypothetical protein